MQSLEHDLVGLFVWQLIISLDSCKRICLCSYPKLKVLLNETLNWSNDFRRQPFELKTNEYDEWLTLP